MPCLLGPRQGSPGVGAAATAPLTPAAPAAAPQGGAQPRSFAEQAKDIGVSVKVVERLAQSGLEKLRHPSRAAYLLPFLDTSAVAGDGMGDDD